MAMKTITKFDKTIAKQFGEEVVTAVKAMAAAHGLEVSYAGGTYGDIDNVVTPQIHSIGRTS